MPRLIVCCTETQLATEGAKITAKSVSDFIASDPRIMNVKRASRRRNRLVKDSKAGQRHIWMLLWRRDGDGGASVHPSGSTGVRAALMRGANAS